MRSKTMFWTLALAVVISGPSLVPSLAAADIQGFLSIPGLPGESQDIKHKDQIDLVSYTQAAGTKACFRVMVVKNLDKASPGLALLAVTNRVVRLVTVTLAKAGDTSFDVFTAVLKDVVVETVELVEVDGGPIPTERVTLLPTRATLTYMRQNEDGSPGPTTATTVSCP